ncbi:MAG TPA: DUF262 domain-containing protein [Candidatus Limnocylindria bacterium]|nr:DUF262 domain-containing protein [Candidatus Limnocylindria bacterium]
MEIRKPEFTVADYCAMYSRDEVRVNPEYQRSDQVWPRTAQSFLVETILLGFPIPKLFLHQQTDLRTGGLVKEIVDGQQRTRAIVDYFNNEYALTGNISLEEAKGLRFAELPEDLFGKFRDYGLQFDLFVGATDEDVREVFRRMNSFTVPLNPEEQRHAEFQGEFKWFMRTLSTSYAEAMRLAGVFTQKSLVRMQDQKLLTEICAAFFSGIKTTNKLSLDAVYREHDRPEQFSEEDRTALNRRIRHGLDTLFAWQDLHHTPLMKPHQVYALVLAAMHLSEPIDRLEGLYQPRQPAPPETVVVNLTRMATVLSDDERPPGRLRPFVDASAERTNVKDQRETRFKWYCRALTDQLPD